MNWQSLIAKIAPEDLALLTELLFAHQAQAVSHSECSTSPKIVEINALFEEDIDLDRLAPILKAALGKDKFFAYRIEKFKDKDWIEYFQQQYRPIKIAEGLWIVPAWCSPLEPEALNIMLTPGIAFGTGQHPTTKMCLRWLKKMIKNTDWVLDYGCGSGILGIAALKLGAQAAYGTDIDPQALLASQENARLNKVKFPVFHPTQLPDLKFNIILANIWFKVLIELIPTFKKYLKPQGYLVLSGINQQQASALRQHLTPWFYSEELWQEGEWCCLISRQYKN